MYQTEYNSSIDASNKYEYKHPYSVTCTRASNITTGELKNST